MILAARHPSAGSQDSGFTQGPSGTPALLFYSGVLSRDWGGTQGTSPSPHGHSRWMENEDKSEKIRTAETRLPLTSRSSSTGWRERKQEVGAGSALYLSSRTPLSIPQGWRPCASSPAKHTLSTGEERPARGACARGSPDCTDRPGGGGDRVSGFPGVGEVGQW